MSLNTRKLGYTTSEAARRLGVSLSTVRRWSDLGYLRGYRTPGGQRRFSAQQLDDFLASLEDGPQRPAPGGDDDAGEPGQRGHHEDAVGRPDAVGEHVPPFRSASG